MEEEKGCEGRGRGREEERRGVVARGGEGREKGCLTRVYIRIDNTHWNFPGSHLNHCGSREMKE
jgi:hypothetical protein